MQYLQARNNQIFQGRLIQHNNRAKTLTGKNHKKLSVSMGEKKKEVVLEVGSLFQFHDLENLVPIICFKNELGEPM